MFRPSASRRQPEDENSKTNSRAKSMSSAAEAAKPEYWTQSGKDSQLSDAELAEKYKEIIDTTTLYYRIRHVTRAADGMFNALENAFYGARLDAPLNAPIFPLGNFRSGTSFLEKVISDHPTVGYFTYTSQIFPRSPVITRAAMRVIPALNTPMLPIHMPANVDALSPYEGEPIWRWCSNNCWTDHDVNVLDRSFADPAFERLLLKVINKHLLSQGKSRFVNKNPWNTLRVGYLSKLYPDAKFVYITRHPHRMLRSQVDLEGIHERTLGHISDFNSVFSDQFASPREFFRTPSAKDYIERYKTDRLLATAMSIADFDATFDQEVEKAGLGERIYRVRYEDLLSGFGEEMRRIFNSLGLNDAEGEAVIDVNEEKYLRKDLVSSKTNLPRYRDDVEEVLAPLAKKHVYDV
jgi:hypothetical protein